MTQEKRDKIASKNGLTKTDNDFSGQPQYIGTRKQWNDYDNDCMTVEEMEADMIEDQQQRWGEQKELTD